MPRHPRRRMPHNIDVLDDYASNVPPGKYTVFALERKFGKQHKWSLADFFETQDEAMSFAREERKEHVENARSEYEYGTHFQKGQRRAIRSTHIIYAATKEQDLEKAIARLNKDAKSLEPLKKINRKKPFVEPEYPKYRLFSRTFTVTDGEPVDVDA